MDSYSSYDRLPPTHVTMEEETGKSLKHNVFGDSLISCWIDAVRDYINTFWPLNSGFFYREEDRLWKRLRCLNSIVDGFELPHLAVVLASEGLDKMLQETMNTEKTIFFFVLRLVEMRHRLYCEVGRDYSILVKPLRETQMLHK